MVCFAGGSFTGGFLLFFELPAAVLAAADFAALGGALLLVLVLVLLLFDTDATFFAGAFAAVDFPELFAFAAAFAGAPVFAFAPFVDLLAVLSDFFAAGFTEADFSAEFFVLFPPDFVAPPTSERMKPLTLNPDFSAPDFAAGFLGFSAVFVLLFELTAILLSRAPWDRPCAPNR